ncbi:hypothetical protein MTER_18720 [Mycolicibacter terrae]|uniref:Glutathione synthase/ribosomal protein S6 modification enzyme n=1 Tax=Mycolicibacter terrae TaxID=1788 RepID=A0AAD1HXH7_9MYCO|nr:hypothetical protein [Mycolicibacter terrae]ORW96946.1 hypothetical protein AWC28_09855 [Mycolicibacter terrae]BBX22461.1 hypothetical protein MTER_18720 [Mycolicibacter terrae]SNV75193.1 glutathione synthase/ribosomal protein S6 modification enzyme [Mycolicibacter terrae]
MKLARPDILHPRIVLAGDPRRGGDDGPVAAEDAGLIAALRHRGLQAHRLAWDDPATLEADLVILRSSGGGPDRRTEFAAWTKRVRNLLNPPEVVAWNSGQRYLADLQCDGVPTSPGGANRQTALVFFGGGRSHAFGAAGTDPDFELWDVGRAALRAAAERLSIRIEELLYARAEVAETAAGARLVSLDLVAPQLGWADIDASERDRAQRRFALEVAAALERLGFGPLAQRRP